ncbi:MAG: trehalose-phosphatase [Bdellovibrionaceae bacterium]|jgi:trehalose 6-phosphate phosphatase|nr:trehalose-phosphatase [Pseudobdellovibrionaceae bacterium]
MVLESLSFTNTLYAFDFDGTLAKIVHIPSEACMTSKTEGLLKELSSLAPVAIVTGRSIQDLKKRLSFQPQYLVGNHGLERPENDSSSLFEAKRICTVWIESLKKITFESGIEIEDKTYSIAIHYRRSRNKTRAKNQIRLAIASLAPPPRIIAGKSVYNLLSSNSPHKGAAILDLMQKSRTNHAFYIGDDDTDEDVFGLPYNAGQLMTVRVGQKKSSRAKYFIRRQSDINRLLKDIIRFHRHCLKHTSREAHSE